MQCENPKRPYLRGVSKHDAREVVYIRPDCKLWGCPACGERKRKTWAKHALYGAASELAKGSVLYMYTLTSHRNVRDAKYGLQVWRSAWKKLSTRINRHAIFPTIYLSVYEQVENSHFHVHFIGYLDCDERWLKNNCAECGLGYQVDITELQYDWAAAWYVTKYLGKQLQLDQWPKNTRRINTSQNWKKMPLADELSNEYDWDVILSLKKAIAKMEADSAALKHVRINCDLLEVAYGESE